MAKGFGALIEEEINSARNRLELGRIDGVDVYETFLRLNSLKGSLEKIGSDGDEELFRYFPVAAIAALEGHFKAVVATVVNEGSEYTERGIVLAKDKLKSATDILPLLHRQAVSIGDLVAYVIPFNSIGSIENAFTTLLNKDFKELVAKAINPYDVRNRREKPRLLVHSVKNLWTDLALAFERRHILAHETATRFSLTYEDAKSAIDACKLLAEALDAILWATIWKETPLTQYEMNCAAWESRKAVRCSLAAALRKALKIANSKGVKTDFCRIHLKWKIFNREWSSWETEFFWMGSIAPMLSARSQEKAFSARKDAIENWIMQMD